MREPGILTVLFDPTDGQVDNLIRIRPPNAPTVVVDNSEHPSRNFHDKLGAAGIEVLVNDNAGGLGGAYNKGIAHLSSKGCQVYFILDQDSELSDDYFDEMTQACSTIQHDAFIMGPKIFDMNTERYLPTIEKLRVGSRMINFSRLRKPGLVQSMFVISAGSVISASAFEEIGPFREGFFLDHVDTEYCIRAVTKKVPIYVNTAPTMRIKIGRRLERRVFGKKKHVTDHPAYRRYYLMRNSVRIVALHGARRPGLGFFNMAASWILLVIALAVETDRVRKVVAIWIGLVDGVLGRDGPFPRHHPRLARFCRAPYAEAPGDRSR